VNFAAITLCYFIIVVVVVYFVIDSVRKLLYTTSYPLTGRVTSSRTYEKFWCHGNTNQTKKLCVLP